MCISMEAHDRCLFYVLLCKYFFFFFFSFLTFVIQISLLSTFLFSFFFFKSLEGAQQNFGRVRKMLLRFFKCASMQTEDCLFLMKQTSTYKHICQYCNRFEVSNNNNDLCLSLIKLVNVSPKYFKKTLINFGKYLYFFPFILYLNLNFHLTMKPLKIIFDWHLLFALVIFVFMRLAVLEHVA